MTMRKGYTPCGTLDEDYADQYLTVGSTRQVEYDDHLMYDTIIYYVSSSKEECVKAK